MCVTMAAYFMTLDALSTDIIGNTCVPWGANRSDALQQSMIIAWMGASTTVLDLQDKQL